MTRSGATQHLQRGGGERQPPMQAKKLTGSICVGLMTGEMSDHGSPNEARFPLREQGRLCGHGDQVASLLSCRRAAAGKVGRRKSRAPADAAGGVLSTEQASRAPGQRGPSPHARGGPAPGHMCGIASAFCR